MLVNATYDVLKEAIFLDPVYTGKAMAGFIDLIHKGSSPQKTPLFSFILEVFRRFLPTIRKLPNSLLVPRTVSEELEKGGLKLKCQQT
jgi:hypothetical protein